MTDIIKCFVKRLSKNKVIESQVGYRQNGSYIDVEFKWSRKCDHAGLRFYIELFGFYFHIEIYDVRHWDYFIQE